MQRDSEQSSQLTVPGSAATQHEVEHGAKDNSLAVPAVSSKEPQSAPKEQQKEKVQQNPALDHVFSGPADVGTILSACLPMKTARAPHLIHEPSPTALYRMQCRLASLSRGLFPGIEGELLRLFDSSLADIDCLLNESANHIESYVKVWISEAREKGSGLLELLDGKVKDLGHYPSELPETLRKAIETISVRVGPDMDPDFSKKENWHRLLVAMLAASCNYRWKGKSAAMAFWFSKALIQLLGFRLYWASHFTVVRAGEALLGGVLAFFRDCIAFQRDRVEVDSYIKKLLVHMEEIAHAHTLAARTLGKALKPHLQDIAGVSTDSREPGHRAVTHLIDILADHVIPQVYGGQGPSNYPFRGHLAERGGQFASELAQVTDVLLEAYIISTSTGHANSVALTRVFPGLQNYNFSGLVSYPDLIEITMLFTRQIEVYRHLASLQGQSLCTYMEHLCNCHGLDTCMVRKLCAKVGSFQASFEVAGFRVTANTLKREHICMYVAGIMCRRPTAMTDYLLVMLDKFTCLCGFNEPSQPRAKAIKQALPGVWEHLFRLHKWPHGFSKELKWLRQATEMLDATTARHSRDAHKLGISREEHIRNVLAVPGLQEPEVGLMLRIFQEAWAAQDEIAAKVGTAAGDATEAPSAISREGPADSSTGAGQTLPAEDVQEDAQMLAKPQGSQSDAEKAERRKAKKARQRAARAEAAAQRAEAEARDSKEPADTEGTGSTAKQEGTDQAQAARQLLEAGKDVSDAALESLPAPNTPAQSAEAAVGSRSRSLSPQPSQQLHTGMPGMQQKREMPKQAAPAAQTPAPAAQEEGPWQQVRGSQRKPGSQRAAQLPAAHAAPKQGRHAPDQDSPPLSPPHLQEADQQHCEAHEHLHGRPQPVLENNLYSHEQVGKAKFPDGDHDDDDICIVCWERVREIVFCPCMHLCTCQGCTKDIMTANALCPMCRSTIQSTVTVKF